MLYNINPNSRPHHTPVDLRSGSSFADSFQGPFVRRGLARFNGKPPKRPKRGGWQRGWQRPKPKNPSLHVFTPPKIHTEPDNDGLEDVFPFPRVYSQVQNVNLPGCIFLED